jgi:uncharacterized membrane protein
LVPSGRRHHHGGGPGPGWAYGGGADGARALLSTIAGSTITVVSVTFSVLVVALTVSSQHFGPRLLTNLMRDTPAQLVLGTFTGTFAYCLMVLRTVAGGQEDRTAFFVPHLAVTGAVVLTLFSVGMLIYYVHHVAVAMQVSEITSRVATDIESAVDRLYPEPLGEGADPPDEAPPEPPQDAVWIAAPGSGYIQEIDSKHVVDLTRRHDTCAWLTHRPGDFVVDGQPIGAVDRSARDLEGLTRSLRHAHVVGNDRTPTQDAAFGIQQLVEVALRALSPGVNEPFTAITCIDRLGQGLTKLLARRIPIPVRRDDEGRPRVIAHARSVAELVCDAFEPIALAAGGQDAVVTRLLETLERLALDARRPTDRDAIARMADTVVAVTSDTITIAAHRAALAERRDRIHQTARTRA